MLEKRGKTTECNDIAGVGSGRNRTRTNEKVEHFPHSENDPKQNPKHGLHEAPQTVELYRLILTLAWRSNRPLMAHEASLVDRLRARHPQLAKRLDAKVSRDLKGVAK